MSKKIAVLLLFSLYVIPTWGLSPYGQPVPHAPSDPGLAVPRFGEDWQTLDTAHFRIHFESQHQAFAQRLAAIAEVVYRKTSLWLEWQPASKTEVVLLDTIDASNGAATPIPYNRTFLYMTAPADGQLKGNEPWLEQVFLHEYVHLLHLDQAGGVPGVLRKIFGRQFFTFPQIFSPSWVTEGLAVYAETDHQKGFGRGQSAIYDAMMRAEVMNGVRSLTELSYHGYFGTDWPQGQVYLYGYYFFEFLAETHGEETVIRYIRNWNRNIIPWRMDARARQTTGLTGEALWDKFVDYLNNKFAPTITLLKSRQPESQSILFENGHVLANPRFAPDGNFYFYANDGRSMPEILRTNGEKTEEVDGINGFIGFDINSHGDILLTRYEVCDNTRIFADLYLQAAGDSGWRRLTECGRYARAYWSQDGRQIAAVQLDEGRTRLVLLDRDGNQTETVSEFGFGDVLGELAWSPDGKRLVAAIKRQRTGWNLELLDIESKSWKLLTQDVHLQSMPRFTPDGSAIDFIADFPIAAANEKRIHNLYRMNLSDQSLQRLTSTTTAVLDYAVTPSGNQVRLLEYTANGQRIVEHSLNPEAAGVVKPAGNSEMAEATVAAIANSTEFQPGQYRDIDSYTPWSSMRPRSWWAWLNVDGDNNDSVGFLVDGTDALGMHHWQAAPVVFLDKEELGGSLLYIFNSRLAFTYTDYIEAIRDFDDDRPDLPEVWDRERRLQMVYQQPFSSLRQSFQVNFGVAGEQITRHFVDQDDSEETLKVEDYLLGLSFTWDTTEWYLHSVSPEDGRRLILTAENYDALDDGAQEGWLAVADWREYLSIYNNHVLAVRWVEGRSDDTTFGFQLGGYVDSFADLGGPIGFGKNEYRLRGYEDGLRALRGQNIRVISTEWRMPLGEYFDGFFVPPIGLAKSSLAIFAETGTAWDDGEPETYYSSAGVEISPTILLGYDTFSLAMSFGAAYGFDNDLGGTELYLRLGLYL